MMALVAFRCGACGQVIAVEASYRNREAVCGGCGQRVHVPQDAYLVELPAAREASPVSVEEGSSVSGEGAANLPPTTQELILPMPTGELPGEWANQSPSVSAGSGTAQDGAAMPMTQGGGPDGSSAAGVGLAAEPASASSPAETLAAPIAEESPWAATGAIGLQERRPRAPVAVSRRRLPWSFWLLAVLVPTTVTFIAIAIILFRLWLAEVAKKERHPLEDLPETLEATSDVSGRPRLIVNPIQSPPEAAVVRLGETKRYDGIEVTPLQVRWEQVVYARTQDGRSQVRHPDRMLALYLRIRNVSDHIFWPFEPAFNLAYSQDRATYTYLTVGEERFYGPLQDAALERIEGQASAELWPASPREVEQSDSAAANGGVVRPSELETKVLAYQSPGKRKLSEALEGLPADTVLRWHVQLRKGRQDRLIKGRAYRLWLTTVVPVQFTIADIAKGTP